MQFLQQVDKVVKKSVFFPIELTIPYWREGEEAEVTDDERTPCNVARWLSASLGHMLHSVTEGLVFIVFTARLVLHWSIARVVFGGRESTLGAEGAKAKIQRKCHLLFLTPRSTKNHFLEFAFFSTVFSHLQSFVLRLHYYTVFSTLDPQEPKNNTKA